MSAQAFSNPQTPYWARASIIDEVDQLELSVAFSSIQEPVANTITTWDDPGVGTYPLTDNRGATLTTDVKVIGGDMSDVDSVTFTDTVVNTDPNKLYVNSGNLYLGADQIAIGATGVYSTGPSDALSITRWSDTTGLLITDSIPTIDNIGNIYPVSLVLPESAISGAGSVRVGLRDIVQADAKNNTFLGGSGDLNLTGINNSALGQNALSNVTTGSHNQVIGNDAALFLTTGGENVAIGGDSMVSATSARRSVAVGRNTLETVETGEKNIALGWFAGSSVAAAVDRTISIGNTGTGSASGDIRIGNTFDHTRTFVAGVRDVTPGGIAEMVVIGDDGQLGSQQISGPPTPNYIGLIAENNTIATVITAVSTNFTNSVPVTIFTQNTENEPLGFTFNYALGTVTATQGGYYKLNATLSYRSASTAQVYSFAFYRDGLKTPGRTTNYLPTTDITTVALTSILVLGEGGTVSIRVQNESSAANLTIDDAFLSVTSMGFF